MEGFDVSRSVRVVGDPGACRGGMRWQFRRSSSASQRWTECAGAWDDSSVAKCRSVWRLSAGSCLHGTCSGSGAGSHSGTGYS